jgi:2-polyprenyl-3-methyl-5-hydroxy-6-metoxy-1,4-benzoquinol methylase
MARKYAQTPVSNEAVYREKLACTQKYFTPQTEVFEFGCGTGSTALEHAPHVARIVATDISAKMLEIGREKADAAKLTNIEFRQLAVDEFEPPSAACDVVLALNLIHLLGEPESTMDKLATMLKPGGLFVQSTVCLADGGSAKLLLWRILIPLMQLIGKAPFVSYLSRKQLRRALERSGFEIVHEREPAKGEAAFIIARKPGSEAAVKYPVD